MTVEIGNGTCGRAIDKDRRTHNGFARCVLYRTGHNRVVARGLLGNASKCYEQRDTHQETTLEQDMERCVFHTIVG